MPVPATVILMVEIPPSLGEFCKLALISMQPLPWSDSAEPGLRSTGLTSRTLEIEFACTMSSDLLIGGSIAKRFKAKVSSHAQSSLWRP